MQIQRVKEDQNLARVDGSYIINTNQKEYESAMKRRSKLKKMMEMEEKMAQLEAKLEALMGATNEQS